MSVASAGSRRSAVFALVALAGMGLAVGCSSVPVQVKRADPRAVQRELTATVLTTGHPSARSLQFLERHAELENFAKDPAGTLARIHEDLALQGDHRRLSTLSELSFYYAEQSGDSRYYAMAAIYAYALLFPGPGGELLDPSDPRARLAYDLYNRGLVEALRPGKDASIDLRYGKRTLDLPIGTVDIDLDEKTLVWAGHRLHDFVAASELSVKGLRSHYRLPGLGAPLAASIGERLGADTMPSERFMPGIRAPVTLFARIDDPRRGLREGHIQAHEEIYTPDKALAVQIDGRDVPLEFDTSAALAATLTDPSLWQFELKGFFSGAFSPLRTAVSRVVQGEAPVQPDEQGEGLLFLQPYRRGRVPVVLVHGTASSPARWADLVNEMQNDRVLWDRYQVWLFIYNTGNPIGYSGGLLRRALESAVADLDPQGTDPALRRMVVIGHSQGGLLAKLTAIESGDKFWNNIASAPLDQLDLSPDVRDTLRMGEFFHPEPFVQRVIFVCTPHRGSYLASFSLSKVLSDFVGAPTNLTQVFTELVSRNAGKIVMSSFTRLPTSIDNMTPGNPFIQTLADIPVAPEIRANSIIAVKGEGPPEGQSDGVVRYESAHIDGVESEQIVHSSHSAQGKPQTIQEIRRILLEHATLE